MSDEKIKRGEKIKRNKRRISAYIRTYPLASQQQCADDLKIPKITVSRYYGTFRREFNIDRDKRNSRKVKK